MYITLIGIIKLKNRLKKTHIPIGELKVHCYHILDRAQKENQKLFITKRGSLITEIIPLGTQII